MGSGRKYRVLKEMEAQQKEMQPKSIVKLGKAVAQALEMIKS